MHGNSSIEDMKGRKAPAQAGATQRVGVEIDLQKCVGCLACVRTCIFSRIEVRDGKPFVLADKAGCAKCMHCGIVCPEGAISWGGRPMMVSEEKPIVSDTFPDDLDDFMRLRRSYRDFREETVDPALLRGALTAAAWAPSAKNQHPVKYIVVQGRETVERIMGCILDHVCETGESPEVASEYARGNNMVLGNATNLILAYARDNAINPEQDTALALDYADLWLQARGLGCCWAGYLRRFLNKIPALRAMFPLPDGHSFYGCLLVGWPKEAYLYIPIRLKQPEIEFR